MNSRRLPEKDTKEILQESKAYFPQFCFGYLKVVEVVKIVWFRNPVAS